MHEGKLKAASTRPPNFLKLTHQNQLPQQYPNRAQSNETYEHAKGPELAELLNTDLTRGMSTIAAKIRLEEDGLNELEKPKRPGIATLFLLQLMNLIILLLIAAAVASVGVNATSDKRGEGLSCEFNSLPRRRLSP